MQMKCAIILNFSADCILFYDFNRRINEVSMERSLPKFNSLTNYVIM